MDTAIAPTKKKPGGRTQVQKKTCRLCGETKLACGFFRKPGDVCMRCANMQKKGLPSESSNHTDVGLRVPSPRVLINLLTDLQDRIIRSCDDETIRKASLKDKMISLGKATDVKQVMSGLPTQIVLHEDRENLLNMARMLKEEDRRRATIIDVTPVP